MSDFLGNLLDRTLGETPSIQRYRPSLFEPVAEPVPQAAETPAALPPRREPDAPLPAPPRAPAFAAMDPPLPPRPAAIFTEAPAAEPLRAAPSPPLAAPHIITHHHETRIERLTQRVDTIVERTPAGSSTPLLVPAPPPSAAVPVSSTAPSLPTAPTAPSVMAGLDPATHPAPVKPQAAPVPQPQAPRRAPPQPQTPAITRVSLAPSPQPQAAPPTPAPIEITIGRLEIRATQSTPAAPRPRTSPRGPALGLDAYLRQRGGGTP